MNGVGVGIDAPQDAQPGAVSSRPPPPLSPQAGAAPPRVVLRVEVATKGQARMVTYSVLVLNIMFFLGAIGLLGSQGTYQSLEELRRLYRSQLILGSIDTGLLLGLALWFAWSTRSARLEHRVWNLRQTYFSRTAGALLCLQLLHSVIYVTALGIVLDQEGCAFPWAAVAALEFVRRAVFAFILFFLLVRLQNMKLWWGKGALDMDPDHLLLVDRPFKDKARSHAVIFALWLLLLVALAVGLAGRYKRIDDAVITFPGGCGTQLDQMICGFSTLQAVSAAVVLAVVIAFIIAWMLLARRALKDHTQLPYNRYRHTHIYVRVQARLVSPVLFAVVISVLLLDMVPALRGNCASSFITSLGNLPVQLSMTVAAAVLAILYMPKSSELDSPLLQEFLQDFSWTQAALPDDVQRRNRRLEPPEEPEQLPVAEQVMDSLPGMLRLGLGKLAGVQDRASAEEQLRREPMFCLETVIKLFYWSRLAYQQEAAGSAHKYVNSANALPLFGLGHFETIWDDTTDTHCALGWNGNQVVVAFRGTASVQNVMTDLKAWRLAVPPKRKRRGRVVSAHAGFLTAWLHEGFNEKVLARVKEVGQAAEGAAPMRFWVTGHSLGGALAVLASLEIARQHPDSHITTYTFGCPRVGNTAFADEYDEAVPDTWAILNGRDPIPWIPKVGFKRAGKRVTVDAQGNQVLRPTYFELSVVQRGTSAAHHMTGAYALSIATFLKSQFSLSKALPGGAAGVEQLAAVVDLEKCLVLSNMDLASLRDPAVLPVLMEAKQAEAEAAAHPKRRRGRLTGTESSGGGGAEVGSKGCCGWARGGRQETEEQPSPGPEGPLEQDVAAANEPPEQPAAVAAAAAAV